MIRPDQKAEFIAISQDQLRQAGGEPVDFAAYVYESGSPAVIDLGSSKQNDIPLLVFTMKYPDFAYEDKECFTVPGVYTPQGDQRRIHIRLGGFEDLSNPRLVYLSADGEMMTRVNLSRRLKDHERYSWVRWDYERGEGFHLPGFLVRQTKLDGEYYHPGEGLKKIRKGEEGFLLSRNCRIEGIMKGPERPFALEIRNGLIKRTQ